MAPWDSPALDINNSTLTKTSAHEQHLKHMQILDPGIAIAYIDGSLTKSNLFACMCVVN